VRAQVCQNPVVFMSVTVQLICRAFWILNSTLAARYKIVAFGVFGYLTCKL
jgi:hypothetical protein